MDPVAWVLGIAGTVAAAAIIAAARWFRKFVAELRAEMQAQSDGIRSILRTEIIRDHHVAVAHGSMSTTAKEVLTRNFEAYTGLHGNGVAAQLYEEAMRLPTIDD